MSAASQSPAVWKRCFHFLPWNTDSVPKESSSVKQQPDSLPLPTFTERGPCRAFPDPAMQNLGLSIAFAVTLDNSFRTKLNLSLPLPQEHLPTQAHIRKQLPGRLSPRLHSLGHPLLLQHLEQPNYRQASTAPYRDNYEGGTGDTLRGWAASTFCHQQRGGCCFYTCHSQTTPTSSL